MNIPKSNIQVQGFSYLPTPNYRFVLPQNTCKSDVQAITVLQEALSYRCKSFRNMLQCWCLRGEPQVQLALHPNGDSAPSSAPHEYHSLSLTDPGYGYLSPLVSPWGNTPNFLSQDGMPSLDHCPIFIYHRVEGFKTCLIRYRHILADNILSNSFEFSTDWNC